MPRPRPTPRLVALNSWLDARKAVLEALGIFVGIGLLVFTAWYTYVTQASLRLAQRQFLDQQIPVWDFAVDNNDETIQLRAASPGVRLELATATYPEIVKSYMGLSWPLDPPEHKWHVTMLRSYLRQFFDEHFPYQEGFATVGERGGFPVCLDVSYTQFGESRRVRGIFDVQYTAVRTTRSDTKIELNDVHFVLYLPIQADLQSALRNEWHKLELDAIHEQSPGKP
jgi:hypothetical protein